MHNYQGRAADARSHFTKCDLVVCEKAPSSTEESPIRKKSVRAPTFAFLCGGVWGRIRIRIRIRIRFRVWIKIRIRVRVRVRGSGPGAHSTIYLFAHSR